MPRYLKKSSLLFIVIITYLIFTPNISSGTHSQRYNGFS